ncbi:MAG: hypothetical protein J7K65_10460, partial [Planctomycetes bacterium]|nr:hypothetical protein [Planctomycetota bacterium]
AQCGQSEPSLVQFLPQGRPVRFENSNLSLSFGTDGSGQFAKTMCQRKLAVIQDALSRLLSTDVKVCIESSDSKPAPPEKETPDSPPPTSTPTPSPAPAVSGVNRAQRQQALNDPAVQMVLKGLNATPVEIQKIEIQPDDKCQEPLID